MVCHVVAVGSECRVLFLRPQVAWPTSDRAAGRSQTMITASHHSDARTCRRQLRHEVARCEQSVDWRFDLMSKT
jgi:hypothetical protein